MTLPTPRERRIFEIMLILITVGITFLLYRMGAHKIVALNLFFLPIVLAGYYLGRTTAGVLALFCALGVTVVSTLGSSGFASYTTPVMIALVLTVWAGVLGLTAILVGTLCDERNRTVGELQEAYVGVVEVVSRYLQSANPRHKAKSTRIAELSHDVAEEMNLSGKQIDDVRVGSLLHDLGNVEITTQIISKAVDTLGPQSPGSDKHTFLGQDFVQSLSEVLSGAVPLLVDDDDLAEEPLASGENSGCTEAPIGARIIRAVRAFDTLTVNDLGDPKSTPDKALSEMHRDAAEGYDHGVLAAIERAITRNPQSRTLEPALSA